MNARADYQAVIRNHLPAILGWLAFGVSFYLIQRASQNMFIGHMLANLFNLLGIVRGYPESARATALVAWIELTVIAAIAVMIGRTVYQCVRCRPAPRRLNWALAVLAIILGVIALTGGEWYSDWQQYAARLSFVVLMVLAIYVFCVSRAHARKMGRIKPREPRRAKFKFSLRTLLASTTVVCLIVSWVSYQLNWIGERDGVEDREDLRPSPFSQLPALPPLSLRLFGETEYKSVLYTPGPCGPVELARLKSLFPESVVVEINTSWSEYWAEIDEQFKQFGHE